MTPVPLTITEMHYIVLGLRTGVHALEEMARDPDINIEDQIDVETAIHNIKAVLVKIDVPLTHPAEPA